MLLDRIRRRAGAGISLRGLFVAGDRLRPAFRLCAPFPWREIDKAERQAGQRGAVIGWAGGSPQHCSLAWRDVPSARFCAAACPVADSWLEWRNKSLQTGPEEYRDWWRVFHDPILDRLIDIAYSQNLTLLSAGTKVLQARAQLGMAIGEFWPQKQGRWHGKL